VNPGPGYVTFVVGVLILGISLKSDQGVVVELIPENPASRSITDIAESII